MRHNKFREKSAGGRTVGPRLAALEPITASTPWLVIPIKLKQVRKRAIGEETYGPFYLLRR
jgi:hypothetical protein